MTALSLFLKADKATLAKYRDSGKLFRGIYKITLSNPKSAILLDSQKNIIQEFNSLTALAKYIGIDPRTAKRYLDTNKLVLNYYIVSSINDSVVSLVILLNFLFFYISGVYALLISFLFFI